MITNYVECGRNSKAAAGEYAIRFPRRKNFRMEIFFKTIKSCKIHDTFVPWSYPFT